VKRFNSVADLFAGAFPTEPVYCLYPALYRRAARSFIEGFPGRVLYAVKANDHPVVLRALHDGGVRDFDCASLAEVEAVRTHCPGSTPFFMIPVRRRGAAAAAYRDFGVRHFMVDQDAGLDALAKEIELQDCVIFVRVTAHHRSASQDLSSKFGAPPGEAAELVKAVVRRGAEPGLACNVGSSVLDPAAYTHAVGVIAKVLDGAGEAIRLVDIGGGFPRAYPGFPVPPLDDYFDAIGAAVARLPNPPGREWMCEPGRALAAPGMGALVEVLARRDDRLYLNDGMYGVFWELRFGMQARYAVRCWRDGKVHEREERPFCLFGPTCDSTDVLPSPVSLPGDLRPGDVLEFGQLGAYSLSGRTDFNGLMSDRVVVIDGPDSSPPA
jgi:ornithine decarboxylase